MNHTTVSDYIRLIQRFADRDIDALEFERTYLHMFKSQEGDLPEIAFRRLDALFSDVDSFCSDPLLCDDDDLNEDQLRVRCIETLKQLTEP